MSMSGAAETARILLDAGGVHVSPSCPFEYASGLLSPIYTDCRFLASHSAGRRRVVDALAARARDMHPKVDVLVSAGLPAIGLTALVAGQLGLPMAYVRHSAKAHGKKNTIEGKLVRGQKALLMGDIVSTEPYIADSVRAIRTAGGVVEECLSISTNSLGYAEKAMEREGVSLHCLTDLQNIIAVARTENRMTSDEIACVEEWMESPEDWRADCTEGTYDVCRASARIVAQILLEIKAVTVRPSDPFKYASGGKGPIYTDNRLLMSNPSEWGQVVGLMVSLVAEEPGARSVDAVAGIASSGIAHAARVADALSLPMVYVKSGAESHGKRSRIEGRISSGDRVLLVEDLINTGGSALSAARLLRDAGFIVDWCLAIFTYGRTEAHATFGRERIRLRALTDLDSLLTVAVETKRLLPEEVCEVQEWAAESGSVRKEPRRGTGSFQWNAGGWFVGQIGGTIWMLMAGALPLAQGTWLGSALLLCFLVPNIIGAVMWYLRDRLSPYPAAQVLVAAMGASSLGALVVLYVSGRVGTYLLGVPWAAYWMLMMLSTLMLVFHLQNRSGRKRGDSA